MVKTLNILKRLKYGKTLDSLVLKKLSLTADVAFDNKRLKSKALTSIKHRLPHWSG